jgi:hypothetical protein
MKAPALAEAACGKAAAPDAAVKRHRSARAASLSGREASPDVVREYMLAMPARQVPRIDEPTMICLWELI